MGWTDKTVNVLKDALSPTSSETLLEELWNPGDWRDRCTLVQFIGSGEARCGCWCMDCEMGGGSRADIVDAAIIDLIHQILYAIKNKIVKRE